MATGQNDVERQLRAAIDAAAARTGARISGADSSLVAMILGSLTPSELKSLADSPDAVLGKVANIVTSFADEDLKRQALQGKGPAAGKADDLKAGDGLLVEAKRGVPKFLMDDLAERASNEKGSSSARYTEAGMAIPGNADARGFDIRNYYTSPVTRALVGMGMSDRTFSYVRNEVPGATIAHIRSAARDAKDLGFGVNDGRVVKNATIIRKEGDNPDETMRRMKAFQGDLLKNDDFRKAAKEYDAAKTEEERKKIMDRINAIAEQVAGKKGGVTEDQKRQRSEAVRQAIEEIKKDTVRQQVEEAIKQQPAAKIKNDAETVAQPASGDKGLADAIKAKLAAQQKSGEPGAVEQQGAAKPADGKVAPATGKKTADAQTAAPRPH